MHPNATGLALSSAVTNTANASDCCTWSSQIPADEPEQAIDVYVWKDFEKRRVLRWEWKGKRYEKCQQQLWYVYVYSCRSSVNHNASKFRRTMGASSDALSNRCRFPSSDGHPRMSAVPTWCYARKFEVQLVEGSKEISIILLSVGSVVVYLHRNHAGCYSRGILWWNETTLWSSSVSADFEDHWTCRQQGREDAERSSQSVFILCIC